MKNSQNDLHIVVFGAGQDGIFKEYQELAYNTGKAIAEAGFTLVNGAGFGLMRETSRGAKEAGGKVIGVGLANLEERNEFNDEFYSRYGIHARQSTLMSFGDAFIALPGGMGTLYEIAEVAELKKLREEEPEPVIVLNNNKFYEDLRNQLQKMREQEYVLDAPSRYIDFVEHPDQAMQIIKSFYTLRD